MGLLNVRLIGIDSEVPSVVAELQLGDSAYPGGDQPNRAVFQEAIGQEVSQPNSDLPKLGSIETAPKPTVPEILLKVRIPTKNLPQIGNQRLLPLLKQATKAQKVPKILRQLRGQRILI